MSVIVDDEREAAHRSPWVARIAILVACVVGLALVVMLVKKLVGSAEAPKRQVAKIAILPDTPPPPPPPPPKEEPKKEQPREVASKPVPQDVPKPAPAPPANEPMKMEGAAGDGPSAFSAGSVTREATGGGTVGGASSPGGSGIDRARERFYANSARQMLRDEIERQLRPEAGELTVSFAIWVEPDGRIRRYELLPGEPSTPDMQAALDGTSRELRLPPPEGLTQPLRFRLTVKSQG